MFTREVAYRKASIPLFIPIFGSSPSIYYWPEVGKPFDNDGRGTAENVHDGFISPDRALARLS
jgi:hypothetical protein